MNKLLEKMARVDQIPGKQSILAHGESVFRKINEIINYLKEGESFPLIDSPRWLQDNKKIFLDNLYSGEDLFLYTMYHDCGKPFCLKKDDEG